MRETARVHAAAASEAKVTLLLALDSLIPECVVGDSVRLKSIMSCFIMNGINQASGGHCTIIATPVAAPLKPPGAEEVNVRDEVERVGIRFEVKDDGDGLEDGVGGDIANWGGSSKMSAISLGLFRRIIEAHGGIIGIESQKGRGCSVFFSVFFPLPDKMEPVIEVLNPQRAASRRGSSIDRSSFSSSGLQHIHIHHPEVPKSNIRITTQSSLPQALVADDLLSSRRMVGRVLERMGFDVEYAEDGVFAVELCIGRLQDTEGKEQDGEKERSSSYAIVIMDNAMPNLSGIEAVKKIRQCGYTGPIVGLTGDFSDEAIETFEECGCDAVITKPLDVPELKRTLLSLGVKIPHKNFNH